MESGAERTASLEGLTDQTQIFHQCFAHCNDAIMISDTEGKVLFVNELFTQRIVELSAAESDLLLGYLVKWLSSPRFTLRHRWSEGTVVMWDNRCTQHFVLNDFDEERIIQRVTVMGDRPEGASPRWEPYVRPTSRSSTSRHDRQLRAYLKQQRDESDPV